MVCCCEKFKASEKMVTSAIIGMVGMVMATVSRWYIWLLFDLLSCYR